MIETTVFPVVGVETDKQYVCVTLQVVFESGYPDVSPRFNLLKPRGLDDSRLENIKRACEAKLAESVGFPVVFDLIDIIRENLTGSNLPSGQCAVCLYGFQEGDVFTKTDCYHYFHSYCLARHLVASKKYYQDEQDKLPAWLKKMSDPFKAVCPVCREPVNEDLEQLRNAPPHLELETAPDFKLTEDLKQLQAKMRSLYLYQKSRGAIIDLEAEEGNVISIEAEDQRSGEQKKTPEGSAQEEEYQPSAEGRQPQSRFNQSRRYNRCHNSQTSTNSVVLPKAFSRSRTCQQ